MLEMFGDEMCWAVTNGVYQRVMPGYEGEISGKMAEVKREILSVCLTNVDGPVTALWGRVPPVLAAALTARQSRVAERDIAQVLWNEFLSRPDLGAEVLAYFIKEKEGLDEAAAWEKARPLIRRIIDGFGDDSVREDASAWVFFREFPVLSTLEMFRHPLLTGIEASTRYINWGEKVNGEYLYVFPEGLRGSGYEEEVRSTLNNLFEAYASLWPAVWDYVAQTNPRGEGITPAAYHSAVYGRVCDDLRTLVSLSAMTNGGIHGNFRTLSEIIMDLRASESAETRKLADMIAVELKKINPEFVTVVDNEHGKAWTKYKKELRRATRARVGEIFGSGGGKTVTVSVLNHDYRRDLVMALVTSQRPGLSGTELEAAIKVVDGDFDAFLGQLGELRKNRRHKVPEIFEVVSLMVNFRKLTFGAAKDLNRHRKRNLQSELDWAGNMGYDVPADIVAISGKIEELFRRGQEAAISLYQKVARDYPVEARSLLTHGTFTRFSIGMGLGEAIWLTELRSIASGNPEYRRLAQLTWEELVEQMPELALLGSFVDMNDYSLGRIKEAVRQDLRGRE